MNRIERARAAWRNRGQARPAFAAPVDAGQESVWDYPRPPCIEPDSRRVTVSFEGILLADTTGAVRVLETASPPRSRREDLFDLSVDTPVAVQIGDGVFIGSI